MKKKKHPFEKTERNNELAKLVDKLVSEGYREYEACTMISKNGSIATYNITPQRVMEIYKQVKKWK